MGGAHLRTLQRALEILSTRERLAQALRVPAEEIDDYLSGKKAIPQPVFLAALDIVARGRA